MPVAHVLVGADGHHVADAAALDQVLQGVVEHGVAQYVAHDDLPGAGPGRVQDLLALGELRRDGLLQQDVVALFQGGDGVAHMLPVHGGDHHHVGQAGLRQHLPRRWKSSFPRDIIEFFGFLHLGGVQVRHGHHFHLVREQVLHGGIGAAPVAKPGDGKGNRRFHSSTSFLFTKFLTQAGRLPASFLILKKTGGKSKPSRPVLSVFFGPLLRGLDGGGLLELQVLHSVLPAFCT